MYAELNSLEGSRVDGQKVLGSEVLNVSNPFNGEIAGAVSMISRDDVSRALRIAQAYRSRLSRAERSQILSRAALELADTSEEASHLITMESGLSRRDTRHEVSRVVDVLTLAAINEAIAIANGTAFGLSSGICSNRLDDIDRFMHELHVGSINVWEVPGYRTERTPFGGVKDSGLGHKEGVLEALKAYTNIKTLSFPWGVN